MSDSDLRAEMNKAHAEPLLLVEKKLIGWSLGIGLTLLVLLGLLNRYWPVGS
jgi:hypothetical protein